MLFINKTQVIRKVNKSNGKSGDGTMGNKTKERKKRRKCTENAAPSVPWFTVLVKYISS